MSPFILLGWSLVVVDVVSHFLLHSEAPKKKRKTGAKKSTGRKGKLSKMNDLPLDIWLTSKSCPRHRHQGTVQKLIQFPPFVSYL